MKIKAVVFDFGQVLAHPQDENVRDRMASIAGLDREVFAVRYREFRKDYDRGRISGIDYWTKVIGKNGSRIEKTIIEELIREDMRSWFSLNRDVIDWVDRLKQAGIKTGILSNMPPELGKTVYSEMEKLIAMFDEIVFSFEIGFVKPENEIYEICLRKLESLPEETLFIDDDARNIEGARASGMNTYLFIPGKTRIDEIADVYNLPN